MQLRKLWVKNFKSLRNVELELRQFNLVVGPNGSGKTNLVEALEFFRDALTSEGPPRPWRKWWRPENVVWQRDETLPLTFGLEIEVAGYEASYELTCSVTSGEFRIEREALRIRGWGELERTGRAVKVEYEDEFFERARLSGLARVAEFEHRLPPHVSILHMPYTTLFIRKLDSKQGVVEIRSETGAGVKLRLFLPYINQEKVEREIERSPTFYEGFRRFLIIHRTVDLLSLTTFIFLEIFRKMVVLKQLNLYEIKKPQEFAKSLTIENDARNLYIVLYNLYLREGKLPNSIAAVLSEVLGDYELRFDMTDDGRVFVRLDKGGLRLPPPCIPDGVHKLLAILTALELRPSILAIDELEDSLHPHWADLVLDALKSSSAVVIATTHSPAIVDLSDPEDLVIAELEGGATMFKRLAEPEKIREELRELGITLSERWLWGALRVK